MWQWLVRGVLFAVSLLERLFPQLAAPGPPVLERPRWRETFEACGLDDIETVDDGKLVRATSGTLAVQIDDKVGLGFLAGVSVTGIADGIALRPEGAGTRIGRALGSGDVQIGDASFDRAVFAEGPAPLLRALLDSGTRMRLINVFASRLILHGPGRDVQMSVSIGDGAVRAEFPAVVTNFEQPRPFTIEALLELARRLQEPRNLAARLAEVALQDPVPGVRLACLRTLAHDANDARVSRETLETTARSDAEPEVRLEAALLLDDAGFPMLEALAADGAVDDALSARALGSLGAHVTLEPTMRILEESRTGRRPLTAAAAARAMGATGSASAEAPLLAALRDREAGVQAAAAEGLGLAGTAQAVLALRTVESGARGAVQKAAREAIARIQGRLQGANPGQLALASHEEGQVSLTDDARGRVTLPEPTEPC